MLLLNDDRSIVSLTPSLAGWLGVDPQAGLRLEDLVVAADVAAVREALDSLDVVAGTPPTPDRPTPDRHCRSCTCRLHTTEGHRRVELEFVPLGAATDGATVAGSVRPISGRRLDRPATPDGERFRRLFDLIEDAVVEFEIVAGEPIIRSVNPGFEEVFGYDADAAVGESLNEFVVPDHHDDESTELDRRTADGKTNRAVVTRRTAWGVRDFLYHGIPYTHESGARCGFAIYADITAQRRSREHLQVLHRVLRHNLRNDLNVVLGLADEVCRQSTDPTVTAMGERISERAAMLVTTSEKARSAAKAVERNSSEGRVDLVTVVRRVVDRCRERYPEAGFETDLPDTLTVAVGTDLAKALTNLIENAVEHHVARPSVRVVVERHGRDAVVVVADDGSGIPDSEWEAVFGETDLTQLRHGSGLGLWVVKWVVESAGGRVRYDRSDGWTTVALTVPLASDGSSVTAGD